MLSINEKASGKNNAVDYIVNIKTVPGEAKFEARVRHNINSDTIKVVGDISRTNMYGSQSECMDDYFLRLFCYCTNFV